MIKDENVFEVENLDENQTSSVVGGEQRKSCETSQKQVPPVLNDYVIRMYYGLIPPKRQKPVPDTPNEPLISHK